MNWVQTLLQMSYSMQFPDNSRGAPTRSTPFLPLLPLWLVTGSFTCHRGEVCFTQLYLNPCNGYHKFQSQFMADSSLYNVKLNGDDTCEVLLSLGSVLTQTYFIPSSSRSRMVKNCIEKFWASLTSTIRPELILELNEVSPVLRVSEGIQNQSTSSKIHSYATDSRVSGRQKGKGFQIIGDWICVKL
jgi:hypothetical protein